MKRTFLGWDKPLVAQLMEHLWPQREAFPQMMIVVPTAQSGRRLRETFAERGGCLAPRVVTPSAFFAPQGETASRLVESLVWEQVLGEVDWSRYEALMPAGMSPGVEVGAGMGRQLRSIRSQLSEVDLDISRVARRLGAEHPESERWQALAQLESLYRSEVRRLGGEDPQDAKRAAALAYAVPGGVTRIIIAGVPDPVQLSLSVWQRLAADTAVEVLVHAPESASGGFDPWGVPLHDYWAAAKLDLPGGNDAITVCDTPSHQAEVAVKKAADLCQGLEEVSRRDLTLGVCDTALLPDLGRRFDKAGWDLYNPAGQSLAESGLIGWLTALREWILKDDVRSLSTLLPQVWTGRLVKKAPYSLSLNLARVVDMSLPQNTADFGKLKDAEWLSDHVSRERKVKEAAEDIEKACNALGYWRERFSIAGASTAMREMLEIIMVGDVRIESCLDEIASLLGEVGGLEKKARNVRPERWLAIIIQAMGSLRVEQERAERSLDAQGWLELSYEAAPNLLICGYNEGIVPELTAGDPWLSNSLRSLLGLKDNAARYARDAFLTRSLVEGRHGSGRVEVLFGKRAAGGEPMRPSRLILSPEGAAQAERVQHAFQEAKVETQGAPWVRDWQLNLIEKEVAPRMSVTGLGQYLSCPFRYYLKHVLRMTKPEELREEWSAREFGTIVHEVVEAFGREPEVRDYTKAEAIEAWLVVKFDEILKSRFSEAMPLAVEVQSDSIRKRLGAFAKVQAVHRVQGWEIKEVEWDFELKLGEVTFRGKIDRIDYYAELDEWMVWDYKTGKDALSPKSHHCSEVTARTTIPAHLAGDEAFIFTGYKMLKAGPTPRDHVWCNLQLPLYAVAMQKLRGVRTGVGYIAMTPVLSDIGFCPWEDYVDSMTDAAEVAATRVGEMLRAGVFLPAAEKVKYDDYETLLDGESCEKAFAVNFDMEGAAQ